MIDAEHAIAHNKVMVIDGETLITGSFNFTKAAQTQNAENLLIIRDQALAAQYTQNWHAHVQHSQPRMWAEGCASNGGRRSVGHGGAMTP
jgi:phosphatidylserine/phosphatidylglycerophosphate/cardiolipin synthase-like enzyme